MANIWEELAKPFDPSEVELKVQATTQDRKRGMVVAYVDARTVMDRLDAVLGPGNWRDSYYVSTDKEVDGKRIVEVVCILGIRLPDGFDLEDGSEWIEKQDVGEGDTLKAATSDALKRAAVKFGVGRYLYKLPKVWADLDERGQIKDYEAVKARLLSGEATSHEPERPARPVSSRNTGAASGASGGNDPKRGPIGFILRLARKHAAEGESERQVALELASACFGREVKRLDDLSMDELNQLISYIKELDAA